MIPWKTLFGWAMLIGVAVAAFSFFFFVARSLVRQWIGLGIVVLAGLISVGYLLYLWSEQTSGLDGVLPVGLLFVGWLPALIGSVIGVAVGVGCKPVR